MTPEQKQRMDEAREIVAKKLREIAGVDEYYASLHPNHTKFEDLKPRSKERWFIRAGKILNLKDSEGNQLLAVLDKDQSMPDKPDRWQKEGMDYHAGYYANEKAMLNNNFRKVIIGGEE